MSIYLTSGRLGSTYKLVFHLALCLRPLDYSNDACRVVQNVSFGFIARQSEGSGSVQSSDLL